MNYQKLYSQVIERARQRELCGYVEKHQTEDHKKKLSESNKGKLVGEKNFKARLTWEKVWEIRERYKTGFFSLAKLGKEYGVCGEAIGAVVKNKTWKQKNFTQNFSVCFEVSND